MNGFWFTEEQQAIRDGVLKLCARFDADYWRRTDESGEFPEDFVAAMTEAGWLGAAMPVDLGGSGLGLTEAAIAMQAVAESGAGFSGASALHLNIFGPMPLVKFGTADEDKGLGTGETDYYGQIDLYQNFGTITPFGTVGYRVLGTNATFQLKDGMYASAGAAFRVSPKTVVGAAYDWRSRIIEGAQNGTDAIAFVSTNPNDRWNVLGYLLTGFNDASPDYGVGGLATYKF